MFFLKGYLVCGVVLLAEVAFFTPVPHFGNYFYPQTSQLPHQPCIAGSIGCSTALAPVVSPQVLPLSPVNCPTSCGISCSSPCPATCATSCPTPCNAPCPTSCSVPCQIPCSQPCPTICPNPITCRQPNPIIQLTVPPPTPTPTLTPTPTPTPKPTEPPRRPIDCPPGTIRINDYCHLVYCGSGIYSNGRCITTICPHGTVWSGSRCELVMPQNHTTIHISNVITTNVQQNAQSEINFTNNIDVNITQCCNVTTPDVCHWNRHRYICRNHQYRKCDINCTGSHIILRPPVNVTLPPPSCPHDHCYDFFYPDCSQCIDWSIEYCPIYCQRPVCQSSSCQFIELQTFCTTYPGSIGCRSIDGCVDDWCR